MSRPLVAVLDYGIGNLRSAQKSLERVGADARLTADAGLVRDAAAVVLPGVGAFGPVVQAIRDAGLADLACEAASSGRPFLGICVGMQVMYEASEESPGAQGLGILPGTIYRLPDTVKRPQMQWNKLAFVGAGADSPLLAGLSDTGDGAWVYFVHSYAAKPDETTIATCEYGGPAVAAVQQENVFATQFHPEKSARNGLRILENFVRIAEGDTSRASQGTVQGTAS